MDGLLLTIHIDEAHPSTQMDEPLLFTLTSPALHIRQTGSFLQFLLTSSSLNSDGRAPTIHIDEPSTACQTDGLLPTIHIDEAYPSTQMDELLLFTVTSPPLHIRQTGSFLQSLLTSSPFNSDGRAPTIYLDEPSTAYQKD